MSRTSPYSTYDTGGTRSKVDLILGAYSQLRISGITRSPTPEDLETALDRLEDMAAEWASSGLEVGYNFEDQPDPNSNSGVIRGYANAFKTNLAIRLIPDFNKQVPPTLNAQATQSLSNLSGRVAASRMRGVDYPSRMPSGSGNSYRYGRWAKYYRNAGEAPLGSATTELFIGDIQDYVEHFGSFLRGAETVDSYSIVADDGLSIESDSLASPDVLYRVKGTNPNTESIGYSSQVTIVATTSEGRILTRIRYFQVTPRDN